MTAEASELERRTTVFQERATKAGHQCRQQKFTSARSSKSGQKLVPSTARNIEASALYNIKVSPGKGFGMFAASGLRKGTRIISESPFFTLAKRPVISSSDTYAPNAITNLFNRLSASEQFVYMGLHCPKRTDCSLIVGIYEANCYEMGHGTCICVDASKINHSCIPNAHYSWNDTIQRITVHAVKDIPEGEEITISYCVAINTLEGRKRALEVYGFTCSCPACQIDTEFARDSLIRRQQMVDLDHEIADYQNDRIAARAEHGHCDEWTAIMELWGLLDEEGLFFDKVQVYHDLAECALKRGWKAEALALAGKELEADLYLLGTDSPSYKETMFFLEIYFGGDEIRGWLR